MFMIIAHRTADHCIGFPTLNHDRADHCRVTDQRPLRLFLSDTATLHDLEVFGPVLFKARIGFVIDDLKINARFDLQAQFLNAHFDHVRTTDKDRFRQSQRYQFLSGMQNARLFPFRQNNALRRFASLGENRLHKQVGFVNELSQLVDVDVEISNRTSRHARLHRGFSDRRSDLNDQARIKRFWNDVFRTKAQILIAIR